MTRSDAVTIELNPRERRLYDGLRARLVPREPGRASGPRDLLLLLPDLTVMLTRLMRDDRVPRGSKLIAGLGLAYLVSPIDVLPTVLFGPVGMVDDLIVVSAACSRLVNRVHPDVVRSAWPGQGDALEAIQRVSQWSEGLFRSRWRRAFRQS